MFEKLRMSSMKMAMSFATLESVNCRLCRRDIIVQKYAGMLSPVKIPIEILCVMITRE